MENNLKQTIYLRYPILLMLIASIAVQHLILAGHGYFAALIFLSITSVIVLFPSRSPRIGSFETKTPNPVVPALLWFFTIFLRLIRIENIHPIQDLSARFMLSAIRICRGTLIFPCIPEFEHDEALISWILSPFVCLFGYSWPTIKIASIVISSFLIPVVYLYVNRLSGLIPAFLASGFLIFNACFQYTDPLIDMSRFIVSSVLLLLVLITVQNALSPEKNRLWFGACLFFMALSVYIHSVGRINVIIGFLVGLHYLLRRNRAPGKRFWIRFGLLFLFVGVFMLPFAIYVWNHPEYITFKRRQVYGFHPLFPFTWTGIRSNIVSIVGSFFYRTELHMLFEGNRPLLHPIAGAGALGGIWWLLFNRRNPECMRLILSLILATFPLIFLTPGHWRGLYLTVSQVLLILTAGLFFGECIKSLLLFRKPAMNKVFGTLLASSLLITVACIQIPALFSGQFAADPVDQVTLLYSDLAQAPNIPHYFSTTIHEMKPGFAIFELLGSAWLKQYAVLDCKTSRILDSSGTERWMSRTMQASQEIRFILAPEDSECLLDLKSEFDLVYVSYLPDSRLLSVTIRTHI